MCIGIFCWMESEGLICQILVCIAMRSTLYYISVLRIAEEMPENPCKSETDCDRCGSKIILSINRISVPEHCLHYN